MRCYGSRGRALRPVLWPRMESSPALTPFRARLAAGALAAALGVYLALTEGDLTNLHAIATTAALAASLAALTRRRRR